MYKKRILIFYRDAILLSFRTKFLTKELWPNVHLWTDQKATTQQLIAQHHIDPVDFPQILTAANVRQVKAKLIAIYKLVYQKARLEQRLLENKQIQQNIQLQCNNYDEDLTHMIDSILNREKRRIVLDRLLHKDPTQ